MQAKSSLKSIRKLFAKRRKKKKNDEIDKSTTDLKIASNDQVFYEIFMFLI